MATPHSDIKPAALWERRALIPNYQVGEAARYAQVDSQTVAAWHASTLSDRNKRVPLSYMQLIEVAVVAAARKAGVKLKEIRAAREWAARKLESEFPFAEYRFKTDGKEILLDDTALEAGKRNALVLASQDGQLAWKSMFGRLKEFEYEGGRAVRWKVRGARSPIIIDPRISFGAPTVHGIATWAIRGRFNAGESDREIADDFGIEIPDVRKALKFEGLLSGERQSRAVH